MAGSIEIKVGRLPVAKLPDYRPEMFQGQALSLEESILRFGRWIEYPFASNDVDGMLRFGVKSLASTRTHAPISGEHIVGWFRRQGSELPWTEADLKEFIVDSVFHESFSRYVADFHSVNPDYWIYMMLGYADPKLPKKWWLYDRAQQTQEPLHFHQTFIPFDACPPQKVSFPESLGDVTHMLNISGEAAVTQLLRKKGTGDSLPLFEQGQLIRWRQRLNLQLSRYSADPGPGAIINNQGLLRTFLGFADLGEFFTAYRKTIEKIEKNGDLGVTWYEDFAKGVIESLENHPVRIGRHRIENRLSRVFGGELTFPNEEFRKRIGVPDEINLLFRPLAIGGAFNLILPQGPFIQRWFSA